jgi:hypothetical protein
MIYETYLVENKFEVNLNQYTKEDLQNLTVLQIKQLLEEEKISVRKMSEDEVIASHQPRC